MSFCWNCSSPCPSRDRSHRNCRNHRKICWLLWSGAHFLKYRKCMSLSLHRLSCCSRTCSPWGRVLSRKKRWSTIDRTSRCFVWPWRWSCSSRVLFRGSTWTFPQRWPASILPKLCFRWSQQMRSLIAPGSFGRGEAEGPIWNSSIPFIYIC